MRVTLSNRSESGFGVPMMEPARVSWGGMRVADLAVSLLNVATVNASAHRLFGRLCLDHPKEPSRVWTLLHHSRGRNIFAFRIRPFDRVERTSAALPVDRMQRPPGWFGVDERLPFQATISVQQAFSNKDAEVKDRIEPDQGISPGRLKPVIGAPEIFALSVSQAIDQQIRIDRAPCGDRLHAGILQTQR